jgi:hypothetical protein
MKKRLKKISVEIDEGVSVVIAKLEKQKGDEVVISIPKDSVLGGSLDGFQEIRQRAKDLGRRIAVESVDDHILEVAELAGIPAANPIFQKRVRPVYDIVPRRREGRAPSVAAVAETNEEDEDEDDDIDVPVSGMVGDSRAGKKRFLFTFKAPSRWVGAGLGVLIVLGAGGYFLGISVLPRATITITLKEYPVSLEMPVVVSVDTPEVVFEGGVLSIPGELLTAEKNIQVTHPAGGREEVRRKAEGKITIYNEFSSEPQKLVARTRFETPEGVVFRLREAVTVPGARVVDGGAQRSSIEVEVIADEAGTEFNIGPIARWTIPGFAGDPRFDGFYGETTESMTGGFVGERAVPTDEEIEAAKEKARAHILDVLEVEMGVLLLSDFEVLEESTQFKVLKEEVFETEGAADTFTIHTEATLGQFVFRRSDVVDELLRTARLDIPEDGVFAARDTSLAYEDTVVDVETGAFSFTARGTAVFVAELDTEALGPELIGEDEEAVKQIVFALPGLMRAHVSLWPFWVRRVPNDLKKIKIVVE